jgi:phage gp36-like protein
MAYITQADLMNDVDLRTLIQLTQDANNATEPNAEVIAQAINDAEGTFESYARTRYTLPVPATPKVKSVCCDIAVYKLFRRRAKSDDGVFKVRKTAYDEAIKFLCDLQMGRAALDVPAVQETIEVPSTGDRILTNAARNKFTDDKLNGF